MNKKQIFLILLISNLFISCSSIFSSGKKLGKTDEIIVKGNISSIYMNKNLEKISRSAYPETTGLTLKYRVQAVDSENEDDIIDAVVTDENFTITLKNGQIWNLTAVCYYHDDDVTDSDYDVLTKTVELDLSDSPEEIEPIDFVLDEIVTGPSFTGYLTLPVSVESNLITKAVVKYKENNQESFLSGDEEIINFTSEKNGTFTLVNTPCGMYDLEILFYMKDSNGQDTLCYSISESVCVLNGLVTEKWNSSQTEYITNGKIFISDLLVQQYKSKYFYVSSLGDDSNAGTYRTPFKTMQKAVNLVNAINDGVSTYNIFVISDLAPSAEDFIGAPGSATDTENLCKTLASINPQKNLKLNITSYPSGNSFTIDLDSHGRAFYFGEKVSVSLSKINIKNGATTNTSNGGAIFSSAQLLSLKNCELNNNIAAGSGGAIYLNKNKTICDSVSFAGNNSTGYGTDIFISEDSVFEMEKTSISTVETMSDSALVVNNILRANINNQGSNSELIFGAENNFFGNIYIENPIILKASVGMSVICLVHLPTDSGKTVYYGDNVQLLKNISGSSQNYVQDSYVNFNLGQYYVLNSDGTISAPAPVITSISSLTGQPATGAVYSISTPAEMEKLSEISKTYDCAGATFILEDNINMAECSPFTPIGKTKAFKGTFDGNNKLITNLNVNETTQYAGLFGRTSDAIIKNVKLNGSVSGKSATGGLVGNLNYYKDDGVYCIENCVVNVTVESTSGTEVGGIIGSCSSNNKTLIRNCINLGSVSGTSGCVGGIAGTGYGKFVNCANLGDILSGTSSVGGLYGGGSLSSVNCYTASNISLQNTVAGAICGTTGTATGDSFTNDYFFALGIDYPLLNGGTKPGITKLQITQVSNLSSSLNGNLGENEKSWDYVYVKDSISYPVCIEIPAELLNSASADSIAYLISNGKEPESGETYSVSTEQELKQLSAWVNAGKSMENVIFSQTESIVLTENFTPIGNSASNAFKGTYYGNQNSITNFNVDIGTDTNGGLFGYISGALIENLYVEGSVKAAGWSGGIVGYASESSNINYCVSNVNIQGNGTGIGGIVGYSDYSFITNCVNLGKIDCNNTTSSQIGGIVGYGTNTIAMNCVNFGIIHGNANVGGLVGYGNGEDFAVSDSYNAGKITSIQSSKCGSISGMNNSYVNFMSCYSLNGTCTQEIADTDSSIIDELNIKSVTVDDLKNELSSNPDWSYTFHSYPVPVDFIPGSVAIPFTPSEPEPESNHKVLDDSYKSVSSYNSSIPVAGDKVKISNSQDISKLFEWTYSQENGVKKYNSLEGVTIALDTDIDMLNGNYNGPGHYSYNDSLFKGTFDGNGYVISNLKVQSNGSGVHGQGLISAAGDGAIIRNVILENVEFSNPESRSGAIVGAVVGQNVLIENCIVNNMTLNVNAGREGGIVGSVDSNASVTIRNCISKGTISATNTIGGIVGNSEGITVIENCASYCEITHTNGITGGIISKTTNGSSSVKNCFFAGTINRPSNSGQFGPIANIIYSSASPQNYENLFYNKDFLVEQGYGSNYSQTFPTGITSSQFIKNLSAYLLPDDSDLMESLNDWVDMNNGDSAVYKRWKYNASGELVFENKL